MCWGKINIPPAPWCTAMCTQYFDTKLHRILPWADIIGNCNTFLLPRSFEVCTLHFIQYKVKDTWYTWSKFFVKFVNTQHRVAAPYHSDYIVAWEKTISLSEITVKQEIFACRKIARFLRKSADSRKFPVAKMYSRNYPVAKLPHPRNREINLYRNFPVLQYYPVVQYYPVLPRVAAPYHSDYIVAWEKYQTKLKKNECFGASYISGTLKDPCIQSKDQRLWTFLIYHY